MKYVMRESPDLFGRALFAEDIRQEASGQFTLVGCYSSGIHVPKFPIVLSRIAVLVELVMRIDIPAEEVRIAAFVPGSGAKSPLWQQIVPAEAWAQVSHLSVDGEDLGPYPSPRIRRLLQFAVSNGVEVPQPGQLQVRAFRGNDVFAIGSLHIVPAETVEN